jgi:hypothetical protein
MVASVDFSGFLLAQLCATLQLLPRWQKWSQWHLQAVGNTTGFPSSHPKSTRNSSVTQQVNLLMDIHAISADKLSRMDVNAGMARKRFQQCLRSHDSGSSYHQRH